MDAGLLKQALSTVLEDSNEYYFSREKYTSRIVTAGKQILKEDRVVFGDSDRYCSDLMESHVALIKNHLGYNVAIQINAAQLGIASAVQYYVYNEDEHDNAESTYNAAVKTMKEICEKVEFERIPFANIGPMVRNRLGLLDLKHREKTYVTSVIYSLPIETESDWRQTIYSNHYPEHISGNMGDLGYEYVFLQKNEISKEIYTDGKDREKTYRYKQKSTTQPLKTVGFAP